MRSKDCRRASLISHLEEGVCHHFSLEVLIFHERFFLMDCRLHTANTHHRWLESARFWQDERAVFCLCSQRAGWQEDAGEPGEKAGDRGAPGDEAEGRDPEQEPADPADGR